MWFHFHSNLSHVPNYDFLSNCTDVQGNCKEPFPTATSLQLPKFQQPAKTLGQCMILIGQGTPTASRPGFDVQVVLDGGYSFGSDGQPPPSAPPIWFDNLMFHSVNPSTDILFGLFRDAVMSNVTLAGPMQPQKRAVIFRGRALHVEGTAVSRTASSVTVFGVLVVLVDVAVPIAQKK